MGNIFEHFIAKFSQEAEMVKEGLSEGAMKSYDEYRYYCGLVRGLMVASSIVGEMKANLEASEDE